MLCLQFHEENSYLFYQRPERIWGWHTIYVNMTTNAIPMYTSKQFPLILIQTLQMQTLQTNKQNLFPTN